jgi:hypothetical protein
VRNPFVGLRAFSSSEQDLFFGRAKETSVLRDLVLTLPVLVVYAPSGTGKSSLINAGLIPEIRKTPSMLDVSISDPRLEPTTIVRDALAAKGWTPENEEAEHLGLAEFLELHYKNTDRRVVVVLDQFEERIKQHAGLEPLYREIAKLANTRSEAATIVISIREDYLAGLDGLMRRVTGLLDAGYRVPPLSRRALTEAVLQPLSVVGADAITAEPELVDRVLTDLEQQGQAVGSEVRHIEPGYFQIVWHRLWAVDIEGAGRSTLTLATYLKEEEVSTILKSFVMRILDRLLPFEAALLQAALRYLVLPTGAKVPLTVDDLVGLLRPADVSLGYDRVFFPRQDYEDPFNDFDLRRPADPTSTIVPHAAGVFDSLFEELTRTDAPLFRRVWRESRQEFELVHDLLGNILNEWSKEYATQQNAQLKDLQYSGMRDSGTRVSKRGHYILVELIQVLREVENQVDADRWDEASAQAASDKVSLAIETLGSRHWRDEQFREVNGILRSIGQGVIVAAFENPDRKVRQALQRVTWQLVVTQSSQQRTSPSEHPWRNGAAATIFGVAATASSILLTIYVSSLLSFLPAIAYRMLTFGTVGVGLAFVYGGMYVDKLGGDSQWVDWYSLTRALWPMAGIRTASSARPSRGSDFVDYLGFLSVFVWWPLLFTTYTGLCYIGAAIFDLFGWAPTAGFNLMALLACFPLVAGYFVAAEI